MTHKKHTLRKTMLASVTAVFAFAMGGCESTSATPPPPDVQVTAENTIAENPAVEREPDMAASGGTLILNVSGYKKQTGQIMVALYNDETAFDTEAAPLRDAKVAVEAAKTSVTFEGLEAGAYAFKVFHDENGNGKLDTGSFGIPTESYAFSMDASDPFSAPEFEESKFILESGETTRNVSLD